MTGRPSKHHYDEPPDSAARTRATRAAQRQAGRRYVQFLIDAADVDRLDRIASDRNLTRHELITALIRDAKA